MSATDDPMKWLRACAKDPQSPTGLTRMHLAALTGTDSRVLRAVAHCFDVYAHTGNPDVLSAVRTLLPLMQKHTRPIARELIAWAMDWSDRDRVWERVA